MNNLELKELKIHRYIPYLNMALHNIFSLENKIYWNTNKIKEIILTPELDNNLVLKEIIIKYLNQFNISNAFPATKYVDLLIDIRNRCFHPE